MTTAVSEKEVASKHGGAGHHGAHGHGHGHDIQGDEHEHWPPDAQFGKLMSISDELMWRYFELLSFRPLADIAALRKSVADGRTPDVLPRLLAGEELGTMFLPASRKRAGRGRWIGSAPPRSQSGSRWRSCRPAGKYGSARSRSRTRR